MLISDLYCFSMLSQRICSYAGFNFDNYFFAHNLNLDFGAVDQDVRIHVIITINKLS